VSLVLKQFEFGGCTLAHIHCLKKNEECEKAGSIYSLKTQTVSKQYPVEMKIMEKKLKKKLC
jgi:hypothetical protein